MDSDDYFSRTGLYSPGKGVDESKYSGFIQVTGKVDLVRFPLHRRLADYAVKLEGKPRFIEQSLAAAGDVTTFRQTDPNYHLIMDSFQRRLVHNAFALGRATRRKVVELATRVASTRCVFSPQNRRLPFHQT